MIKSFAARAIIPIALAITGFVVLGCVVLYSFIHENMVEEARLHQKDLALTVLSTMRHSMLQSDRQGLSSIIQGVGGREGVKHIRIFSRRHGRFTFSSNTMELGAEVDKSTEGCVQCHPGGGKADFDGAMERTRTFRDREGIPVFALMVPIVNEPECASAPCHAHPPSEKVLGTLDIGISQTALEASLGRVRLQMVVFCLMVLVLSVGGVSALLWRNVFLPMKELVQFSEVVPHHPGGPDLAKDEGEMEMVIRNIKEMAATCQEVMAHQEDAEKEAQRGVKKNQGPGQGGA